MNRTLPLVALLALCISLVAPATTHASQKEIVAIDVATDSLVWVLDGYSAIVAFQHPDYPDFRLHTEVFGLTFPDTFVDLNAANADEGWERVIDSAFMLALDHHPIQDIPELHYSVGFNVQSSTLSRKGLIGSTTLTTFELLLMTGYRWVPFSTWDLFVTPYLAIGIPFETNTPDALGGEVFEEPTIQWVGSVRVGWTFEL